LKLSKSIAEYLAADGWSSHYFLEHAKIIFSSSEIKKICQFEVGRSVIYLRAKTKMLKAYVHYNGRSREFMTFTDEKGKEVKTFHHSEKPQTVVLFLLEYLS